MARQKRRDEGEVPIMRGWRKLPVKELPQEVAELHDPIIRGFTDQLKTGS